eukprot:12829413-Prorocentrum_lima.AAC.1
MYPSDVVSALGRLVLVGQPFPSLEGRRVQGSGVEVLAAVCVKLEPDSVAESDQGDLSEDRVC